MTRSVATNTELGRVQCEICPHNCKISVDHKGLCGARKNVNGRIIDENYGIITSIALDPIEKKPLRRFFPGSKILSVGSYGCNFRCSFCQNHAISMDHSPAKYREMTPLQLVEQAGSLVNQGNIGLAYTYNEPLIGYEFVRDCASLVEERDMKNVVVTNGFINPKPLQKLLSSIHAMNIDMKSFSDDFYQRIGGDLQVVKNTIAMASSQCHVEVTTLVIPGENDSVEEMKSLSKWLASVDTSIPLHISKFYPAYQMVDKSPTPADTVRHLAEIAMQSLEFVYMGNL